MAGTPAASDFLKIKITEAQLVVSNSRQITIKSETQKQINKLTDTINKVIIARKNDLVDNPHLYEALLARNRMLFTEITNLILTITLAKANIVKPTILDHADLKSLVEQDTIIVSLIEASETRVLQSANIIHNLIAYPKVKFRCKKSPSTQSPINTSSYASTRTHWRNARMTPLQSLDALDGKPTLLIRSVTLRRKEC